MADIVIRDMEMPNKHVVELMRIELACVSCDCDRRCENCSLVQDRDELIMAFHEVIRVLETVTNAVSLPKGHGRIVDAAEILEKANNSPWFDGDVSELGLLLGSEVTTIIPAEKRNANNKDKF